MKGRANLWTQGPVEQHQIDVQTIEELFSHDDCQSNSKVLPTRAGRSRTSFRETKEEVCILDGKRGMNIGIFLKQFKRSNQSIVEDVRSGNSGLFGAEPLRELLKLLPESDEVKKLKLFRGDVSKLSLADSFIYLLIQLPSYVVRIESMLLKEEFPAECESMKHDIRTLRSAIRELMCCEELHAVLHLVLQAGNILNAGGYAGNAVGFKLSSLPSLAETKANKPGMNLLHFVALEAQKKDEKLLEFPLKLGHVQAASRISLETLDCDLQRLVSRTRSIEESVQRDTELLQQLDTFLQSATSALCSLRGCRQQLKAESEELLDFFCEDKETFKLDDCFSIFTSFCLKFTAAVKDNAERQRKETARRRRLQELEEQKRHSWAAGEQFGGAFGLRSSSELDMHLALSRKEDAGLLMELLMPKSNRSPLLRRSGSFRRNRNTAESDVKASGFKDAEEKDSSVSPYMTNGQKTSQNALNVATNYLRNNERQAETVNTTSDLNNNNGNEACNDQTILKDELKSRSMNEKAISNASNMSVKVEKCTLVPELKAFDKVSAPTKSKPQNDVVLTDFDDENLEKSDKKVESLVKMEKEMGDAVIVWCVTGVCQVDDAQSDTQNVLAGNLSDHMPLNQQTTIQNAVPISSQPLPSIRLVDIAIEAKNEDIKVEGRAGLTSENEGQCTNQARDIESNVFEIEARGSREVGISKAGQNAQLSVNEEQESQGHALNEEVVVQELEEKFLEAVQSKLSTVEAPESQRRELDNEVSNEQNGEKVVKKCQDLKTGQNAKLSVNVKTESVSKKTPSSKTASGSKSVRMLTPNESHNMRRVVPISRPTSGRVSDKPPGNQRGMSSLSVPSRSASRRLERPSTAPSSRRSSFNKADNQDQDSSKKMAAKKTQEKKKSQQEEKICRSTLRSINKEEREVSSAPVTPIHRTTPGFARNTASSSLRRTNTSLEKSLTNKNVPSLQNSTNTSPKILPKTLSPKSSPKSANQSSTNRQNLANSQAASMQNEENLSSKITPPKILSPKLSPSLNLRSPILRNTESAKALSPKISPRNSNVISNQNPPKTLSNESSVQKPTINVANVSSTKIGSASNYQDDSTNLRNKKVSQNVLPDFTHNDDHSNLNFTKVSTNVMLSASENLSTISHNEPPRETSTFYTKLSQNLTKSKVASLNEQTISSHSILASPTSQFLTNSPKMPFANESVNSNNNLDIPHNFTVTPPHMISNLPILTLQNSTNNNLDLPQDATVSALSNLADAQCLENSTKLSKSLKISSPTLLSNAQNLTYSEKSTNSQPKMLSPKAAPRSTHSANSSSRLSPNHNSNLTQNLSLKSSKSPTLSRPGSFRVTSSPKSPDFSVKRSPSVKHNTPPSARRTNDSGSFSEKSIQTTKDSRPTWR